jgi:Histidine kinase
MKSVWRRDEPAPQAGATPGPGAPKRPARRKTNAREEARRLLQSHDAERRRLSLALHDQVAQSLAALATNVDLIEQSAEPLAPRARAILAETRSMARQCFKQVRQLSDELYPMLVAEVGLALALRCLAAAVAERAHTRIACHTSEGPRLPEEIETALFRLADDCLEHLHEPWHGTSAISLTVEGGAVRLAIRSVLPDVVTRWRRQFAIQFGDAVSVQSAYLAADERLPSHIDTEPGLVVTVPAVVVERR